LVDPQRLVIDASLSHRLSVELRRRGRPATALSALHLHKLEDPPMLEALAERYGDEPFVLVTGDDDMPAEHAALIARLALTIATVDPRWPSDPPEAQEDWKRETVHRWAHAMARQASGSIERYSPAGHRTWRPRR
jgi:hypothetical protein